VPTGDAARAEPQKYLGTPKYGGPQIPPQRPQIMQKSRVFTPKFGFFTPKYGVFIPKFL
ncbi:hypothetical protein HGM15179_021831, partial [Zosterops borbonicus]